MTSSAFRSSKLAVSAISYKTTFNDTHIFPLYLLVLMGSLLILYLFLEFQ